MGISARPLLVDDESYLYDDDPARESEFLDGILGGAAQALGSGISGIGNLVGGVGKLINPPPPRPPIPAVPPTPAGRGGVDSATIDTPRGSATLKLPEKVVTEDTFRTATQHLEDAINRNTARLNSTQKDIEALSQRVGVVVADTQRDLAKTRDEARAAFSKIRREQSQRDSNNLMISLLMQQQLQRQIEEHTHTVTVGTTIATTSQADTGGSDNSALMFLPLMFSGQSGSGGDNNNMMMMLMMMTMSNR